MVLLLLVEELQLFLYGRIIQKRAKKKAPKGQPESPWSLHMRSFWKITFINSPEEQGKLLLSQKRWDYDS